MQRRIVAVVSLVAIAGTGLALTQAPRRHNPVVELLASGKPVFGLYAPANPRGRGAAADTTARKTPAQLAADAVAYRGADLIFDGTMEGNFDVGYPAYVEFAKGMVSAGYIQRAGAPRLSHPMFVKTPGIEANRPLAAERIAKQLNAGASGIVFVDVESAEELRAGLAAMRFRSQGGTRPDDVGDAPARWGMSEAEYRRKADLWPLNPDGELVNWTIVESREGLAKIREIAAVKGIGALFPGAGTLRGVFTTTDASGQRVFDEAGWEAAIQSVLAACKEFKVPCGYPANANDIELRMKQGFTVFIISWGEAGFRAVDIGRRVGGRPVAN